jgi:hypothetical protein
VRAKVGPYRIPIRECGDDDENDEAYGSFHLRQGIEIAPDQPPDVMACTVLHEIIHAIWEANKLPETVTEEEACCHLEGPLLDFLVNNNGLVQALRKAVLKGTPLRLLPVKED